MPLRRHIDPPVYTMGERGENAASDDALVVCVSSKGTPCALNLG